MHIHLKEGVEIISFSEETIALKLAHETFKWTKPDQALQELMQSLAVGKPESLLEKAWLHASSDLSRFYYLLNRLKKRSFLSYTLFKDESPFCSLIPHWGCSLSLKESSLESIRLFQLSRFAYIHRKEHALICETPLAKSFFKLHHPEALAILQALSQPMNLEQLQEKFTQLPIWKSFLQLLLQSSFLEEEDPDLLTWDFHDALFHTRSRRGRHSDPTATRFRFLNMMDPLPPVKECKETPSSPWIFLNKPNIASLIEEDLSFTHVLETRRSIRDQGEDPLSLNQLGEFLYRTARIKKERPAQHYEATWRPYPGGGACYELEIYPLVHKCKGLPSALYYYHPQQHALQKVSSLTEDLHTILLEASYSIGRKEPSQIVFLIAARFSRLSWKYQSMAYTTIIKNAGVLLQTMYLVATAMKLAPCAVGNSNSDLFSKATKIPYFQETTVAEFILGSGLAN